MIDRCENPKAPKWPRYGGRGIKICPRWRQSFESFATDMGECFPGMTIDRVDNSKGYDLGNCRWASQREQQNNRSDNRIIELGNQRMTLAQWSRHTGIGRKTIAHRLDIGWPPHKALSTEKFGRSGKPLHR